MSNVVPFRRRAVTSAHNPGGQVIQFQRPESRLTTEEVSAITQTDFPEELGADEADRLVLEPHEMEVLGRYFDFHALRLPAYADADTTYELWRELRLTYGQAVRLASKGRAEEVTSLCSELSADQRAYAIAVGRQERALAQRLARKLFFGRHRSMFCAS
jgi:hypothetical protein